MILDIHGCALTTILANFYTTAKGAYPDLHVSVGGSCVLLEWGSHALSAWVDVMNGCGDLTLTHAESEQSLDGGPDPLDTVVALIAEHITEVGVTCGEGPHDAEPGTFAARVWVARYQARIVDAEEWITRLDPDGRYSVKQSDPVLSDDRPAS